MSQQGIRLTAAALAFCLALFAVPAAGAPDTASLTHMSVEQSTGTSSLVESVFCLRCSQPYTTLKWDMQHESAYYQPLHNLEFEALGIQWVFYAADDRSIFTADVERLIILLQTLDAEIPQEYRRRHVERVVVILSSDPYCLDYEYWTPTQRTELISDLDSYFTSEKTQQNVLGCCTSFPSTRERERVVWMAAGKSISGRDTPREQVNCAYSYHLYCTEEMALMAMFLHEVTHALTLTVTMPTLEDYGFKPNRNWELQQVAMGLDQPLFSVEALAYDVTTRMMTKYNPPSIFSIVPNVWYDEQDATVRALEEADPNAIVSAADAAQESERMQVLADNGVFETMEVIEDPAVPLGAEDLDTMENMLSWVLMDTQVTPESSPVTPAEYPQGQSPTLTIEDLESMDPANILKIKDGW